MKPAKFKPVPYTDMSDPKNPVVTYGIWRKPPGEHRYKPALYDGKVNPFSNLKDARVAANELNKIAENAK